MNKSNSMSLFTDTKYFDQSGLLTSDIASVICNTSENVYDLAAIGSIISFGYICGDRTLLEGISRQPWLCDNKDTLLNIPTHGRVCSTSTSIAEKLLTLLENEAIEACAGKGDVFVLLSGGLDSRIVAGILSRLKDQNRINNKLRAVTWGVDGCRDVVYAKKIAHSLSFEWEHVKLGPEHILENIDFVSRKLGCSIPAIHMHRINWFRTLDESAIVIAGSYGDSIGRAEFSGRHLLELDHLVPVDFLNILSDSAKQISFTQINQDLMNFKSRVDSKIKSVISECEQQAHYMRGMLAPTISSLNNKCHTYQMFTSPSVYKYMWSLHPTIRNDRPYIELLKMLDPMLLDIPWARNNRALSGSRQHVIKEAPKSFHNYMEWISNDLYSEVDKLIDIEFLHKSGVFSCTGIEQLSNMIKSNHYGTFQMYDIFIWLSSFCKFNQIFKSHLDSGRNHQLKNIENSVVNIPRPSSLKRVTINRLRALKKNKVTYLYFIRDAFRKINRAIVIGIYRILYPCNKTDEM